MRAFVQCEFFNANSEDEGAWEELTSFICPVECVPYVWMHAAKKDWQKSTDEVVPTRITITEPTDGDNASQNTDEYTELCDVLANLEHNF